MAPVFPTAEAAGNAEVRRARESEERAGTQPYYASPRDPDEEARCLFRRRMPSALRILRQSVSGEDRNPGTQRV